MLHKLMFYGQIERTISPEKVKENIQMNYNFNLTKKRLFFRESNHQNFIKSDLNYYLKLKRNYKIYSNKKATFVPTLEYVYLSYRYQ